MSTFVGAEDQFNTYRTDNLGMPYDYESIMVSCAVSSVIPLLHYE